MTYSINWPITVRSAVPFRKLYLPSYKDVLRAHVSNKKNFRFRLWASDKPTPVA